MKNIIIIIIIILKYIGMFEWNWFDYSFYKHGFIFPLIERKYVICYESSSFSSSLYSKSYYYTINQFSNYYFNYVGHSYIVFVHIVTRSDKNNWAY